MTPDLAVFYTLAIVLIASFCLGRTAYAIRQRR
jgi:hypothetical protein